MDEQLVQIGFNDDENELNAIKGNNKVNVFKSLNFLQAH